MRPPARITSVAGPLPHICQRRAALKWKVGAETLLSNPGIDQGGTSPSTQKRKRAHSQPLQKAAAQSYSLAKIFQRQRLLGISMKSQADDITPEPVSQGERELDLAEDFPEGQPPELALHECISDVLDPEEERETSRERCQCGVGNKLSALFTRRR
jgi:hypothetical protein